MSKFDLAAKIATKLAEVAVAAPKEHKMLQGMYRGYAGDLPQTLYHAGAAFNGAPRAGTFLNADKAAVKQFGNVTGAAKLHTFDARPRRGGTEADVIDMAKRMGIYDSSVPPGQYLEQGENAVFPEAAQMVDELHNMGIDHIVLADGLSNEPSVVVLDPSMVTRNNGVFLSPQKRVADYYAQKRSAQMGEAPHADMVLVDPFAGEKYNHATMGSGALPPIKTQARKVAPDDIQGRTNLYAQGGPVNKPQGMEHTVSSSQDASTQPLTGSALKALVRGWIAGTAGLPGDLEGLARKGVNWSFGPGGVNVDEAPALPTSEFYKGWLPGKQQGDEMINDIGSVFGGVGATKPVSLAKGALSRVAAATPGPMAGSRAAMRGVIKAPGGNWLSGSVEDALKGLKVRIETPADATVRIPWTEADELENVPRHALNNFVDKQLRNYVRNDMATERDPIRALAERGVLHYDPRAPSQTYQGMVIGKRVKEGFPAEGSSASDLARRYEMASDRAVTNGTYRDNRRFGASLEDDLRKLGGDYAIQNPDAKAYGFDRGVSAGRDLGFDHLMDELRNAVNINSGLPAHLRLDPESLARVSVPQAVERVAKINDWRAAQKVAADQALANNAATVLHKDYPGKGFKWVELKKQDQLPEGWSEEFVDTDLGKLRKLRDPKTGGLTATDPREEALRDALKYEGDTMGHCVGGYCDDVASGKSRIYSLRDAKGQPHTTIEVAPKGAVFSDVAKHIGSERADELLNQGVTLSEMVKSIPDFQYPQVIKQIKGKGNRAPNPEYLPYVQDFVKSGKWSDVGDLQNSGLVKHPSGYLTQEELQALGQAPQGYADGGSVPGYADGGSVRNALNAAVGGSGLVKAVGNTERAVGNIASGNASLGDLKSLRDMASQLGYTVPGLSQALGIAGVAKAGYNMASDPSGMNAAKLAATVNPIAAQALGLYQAATDPTPGTLVDAVSSFNPIARAYNGLANSFNFATIGQVMANLGKIADPNAPAQLRDMFSNNPNSAANAREANEMAARLGIDPMDAMMRVLNADEAAVPGPTVADAINAYNQAQALQTNPSLNPASPDFMGPQADGGAGYTGVTSGGHGGDGSVGGYGSNSYGGAASSVGGSGGYGGYA